MKKIAILFNFEDLKKLIMICEKHFEGRDKPTWFMHMNKKYYAVKYSNGVKNGNI